MFTESLPHDVRYSVRAIRSSPCDPTRAGTAADAAG
jgi:hypothetical protein